jgi:hypothetical protein
MNKYSHRPNGAIMTVLGMSSVLQELVIAFDQINFKKFLQLYKQFERSCMFGKGYLSGVLLRWQLSPHGCQDLSFFGTMCKGEAQGERKKLFSRFK